MRIFHFIECSFDNWSEFLRKWEGRNWKRQVSPILSKEIEERVATVTSSGRPEGEEGLFHTGVWTGRQCGCRAHRWAMCICGDSPPTDSVLRSQRLGLG
jgi:hypothetical protein